MLPLFEASIFSLIIVGLVPLLCFCEAIFFECCCAPSSDASKPVGVISFTQNHNNITVNCLYMELEQIILSLLLSRFLFLLLLFVA